MNDKRAPTPSQTVGPFFGFALPFADDYEATQASGRETVRVEGTLIDGDGQVVSDGLIEVWSQDQFARCRTDAEGAYRFVIARPHGKSGTTEAPHLDVAVFARGLLRYLLTRMYFPDLTSANADDPLLASVDESRRATLIAELNGASLRFDIRLQGDKETVFFAV